MCVFRAARAAPAPPRPRVGPARGAADRTPGAARAHGHTAHGQKISRLCSWYPRRRRNAVAASPRVRGAAWRLRARQCVYYCSIPVAYTLNYYRTVHYRAIEIDLQEAVSRFLNVPGKSGRQSVNF